MRAARRLRGWTQAELAERASLSSNYLARFERGEVGPSLWIAHRVATALGSSIDGLVGGARQAPPLVRTKFAKSKGARFDV